MKLVPYLLLAFGGGIATAVQVGVNGSLRRLSGQPIWASLVSFFVGTIGLGVCFLLTRQGWPAGAQFAHAPWWIWLGGLLGAFYVAISVISGPRLGSAALIVCVIVGQLLTSIVVDHFGWIGYVPHAASPGRIIGAILLLAGVACVLRF